MGWGRLGEGGGDGYGGSGQSLVRLYAVSFVQKLLSWKELRNNYNTSRNQTVRSQATKSSCCGCYKSHVIIS